MLTNSVYCIVDVMFVGLCIGAQGLAAFNIAMPVYTIYSSLGLMLGVGGRGDDFRADRQGKKGTGRQGVTMMVQCAAGIGIVMSAYGLLFRRFCADARRQFRAASRGQGLSAPVVTASRFGSIF